MTDAWTQPRRLIRWPGFQHVFFDCDSTLTVVEGIDVLATRTGSEAAVRQKTEAAMAGSVALEEVYGDRLNAVNPSRGDVAAIRSAYKRGLVSDARGTVEALQALGHDVYIVSGGLAEPVREFAVHLGIPESRVRAVEMDYDRLGGRWWQDPESPLTTSGERYAGYEETELTVSTGKRSVIHELRGDRPGASVLIGDGVSDLLASDAVDLFVGFGGVTRRDRVAADSPVYLEAPSLAPILVLAAGPAARERVDDPTHREVFDRGLEMIEAGALEFNDDQMGERFMGAVTSWRRAGGQQ